MIMVSTRSGLLAAASAGAIAFGLGMGSASAETIISVTQISYDANLRPQCVAVRMNPAVYGSLSDDACSLREQGADDPDRITKTSYDAAGEVTQIRKAVGVSQQEEAYANFTYSPNGKQTSVTDANGNYTKYEYDGFDRLSKTTFPSSVSGAGVENGADAESYDYDANGNLISLHKRDGSVLTYAYDALNRVIQKRVPDPAGASAAGTSAKCHNLLDSDTNDVCYDYDLAGHETYARFGSEAGPGINNNYDALGRLTSSTNTMGGSQRTLSSQYNEAGERIRLTYPDGQVFAYDYDAVGHMTGIWEKGASRIVVIGYDNLGRRKSLTDGVSTRYDYDGVSRLKSMSHDLADSSKSVTFDLGYNAASQLTSNTRTNNSYDWTNYAAVSRSYKVNGLNQYTDAGPASFSHDANGNLTGDRVGDEKNDYSYDRENRLIQAYSYSPRDGSSTAYLDYDPNGRLFQTRGGNLGTTQFVYDGDALVAEYDGAGNLLRRYVHGPGVDEPLLWYEGSDVSSDNRRSLRADHHGSIVAVAGSAGNSIAVNTYDEYGIPGSNNLGSFAYTGQIWIRELRMYYYKARIYSPTLGRFLQTDPIGYASDNNLYAYTGNDPVNRTDPSGLDGTDQPAMEVVTVVGSRPRTPDYDLNLSDRFHESLEKFRSMFTGSKARAVVTNKTSNRKCDSVALHRAWEMYQYGGLIGKYGAWWTGLAWSAGKYAPIPQAKAGIAAGAAIGAAATGTGYGFQFYGAYQIYQQTGNSNFLTNSAIGFLLDKSGRLDDLLTPLGSDAGSSAVNSAAEYLEGQNGELMCRP